MKNSALLAILVSLLLISCKKEINYNERNETLNENSEQRNFKCGMEEAMAKMPADLKQSLVQTTPNTEAQASELLIFLDFDGALVRRGNANPTGSFSPIIGFSIANCPAPSLTAAQVTQIVNWVEDEFSPFNIVVTTEQQVFDNYPSFNKQICIVTTLPSVAGFGPGVAGISPFAFPGVRLPFNPCFAFAHTVFDPHEIALVIAHEVGHTLGLNHQHQFSQSCGFLNEYHAGFGTGPTSYTPIMGIGFDKAVTNWYSQDCIMPLYGVPQNDFELLASQVTIRPDDHPDVREGGTTTGLISGILEEEGDVDFIQYNFRNPGSLTLHSDNIDLKVSVYNNGGHLQAVYNDPETTNVTIPFLNGKRWLKIEAASNPNMEARFMTGRYTAVE